MDLKRNLEIKKSSEMDISAAVEKLEKSEKELNSNLKAILRVARKNGGVYDKSAEQQKIKEKGAVNFKAQIAWNESNIHTLLEKELLVKKENKLYINPLILKNEHSFAPGKKHIALMRKNKLGELRLSEIKSAYKGDREKKMVDSMIKSLYNNGFLDRKERGIYLLTDKAQAVLSESLDGKTADVITYFDRYILDLLNDKGEIDKDLLNRHEKAAALAKRIITLQNKGYIKDDRPVDLFYKKLESAKKRQMYRNKKIEIELSQKEKCILKDLRKFNNLTEGQISKYIFAGEKENTANSLLKLLEKKVLVFDSELNTYYLTKSGIKLSENYIKDVGKYRPKVLGRREEVKHDLLVYTAYREEVQYLEETGAKIISVKTDRDLRSAVAKECGFLNMAIPDLRIEYSKLGEKYILDIEIDCGYSKRTIAHKVDGLFAASKRHGKNYSISWYCHSAHQLTKFLKTIVSGSKKAPFGNKKTKIVTGCITETDVLKSNYGL